MKALLGEISVPLSYGELNSLIVNHAEWLANYSKNNLDLGYVQQKLDRLNVLVAKLREFEQQAEQNSNG